MMVTKIFLEFLLFEQKKRNMKQEKQNEKIKNVYGILIKRR